MSDRSAPRTLVLGLGNPLRGDDGAGPAVLAALGQIEIPEHVDLLDGGTPGLETVLLMEGYERVVVVDSAEMNLTPGAWRRFTLAEAQLTSDATLQGTLHDVGLAEALSLAAVLDRLPPELIIYGIQPQTIAWEPGLSPPVAHTIPTIAHAIYQTEIETETE